MYTCLKCFEVYRDRAIVCHKINTDHIGRLPCFKEDCLGSIVELDELIAPTIIELNKKGYLTKFCCAGHWYKKYNAPYIYFLGEEFTPEIMPEYFHLEENDTIRSRFESKDDKERYDYVININNELYKWARELPVNEQI